ncbi:MAG: hypothetical protein US68_C0006G0049 [Candidatus Shapirobacteria bacterium GW2011_GWE1_38_10]|uniref:Asl1-like glycosyl hydrolase catalytic domain-containing protein n=1 Tax=Candidatus Shapirobacteria bacterium GW2011_GWE1_38_10 TaxID=1618488 RepID=A0A0G0KME4_9BACT|nr:MAG: hypothetical protein US46_C0002G0130 [Candidatus Shapirobacteria bacterium GW2011_GWF2_37_20]KKQ50369.1 MAG: hypothetical protein US68_C0006G0049 [Candidatus Shapirobacteria bacterium GW2011_GWE1_38_10]KKQ65193.1 MAG: hypothetical protein US85_C0001G0120 [Candidatus Shapirobacteria bacterium GW2011_GWF1_38_23]HBP51314.1 hypothetical protein [Candidatus Shapirobacteria bacterium]
MFLFCLLAIFFLNINPILASERNIFGLHLTQTSDLDSAKDIINSNSGDWGYVTVVIRTDQLDVNTWQEFFDNCRKYHIIPIIRLATIMQNNYWVTPSESDIDNLANLLNSLNWPTIPKYIIPFNEINHAKEWGGEINIKEFTDIFIYTSQKFKSLDSDFYILSSALDLAASETSTTKSAKNIYQEIYSYNPKYFDSFDALASHSYPNHGYIGTPDDTGQHSIRGYQWELDFIRKLGINNSYPVFITETGWPHREGVSKNNQYYSVKTTVDFYAKALTVWQQDEKVIAVTPFIYNYSQDPFDHFSWLDPQEQLYPEYQSIIDLPKNQNHPKQITKFAVQKINLPFLIFSQNQQSGSLELKNIGQSIWGESNFCLEAHSSSNIKATPICTNNSLVYPGRITKIPFQFQIDTYLEKSYLGWKDTPQYEIDSLSSTSTIYHPKDNFWQRFKNWFKEFLS